MRGRAAHPLAGPRPRQRPGGQAGRPVRPAAWATPFSDHSYGFRPRRSAHQAIARAQQSLEEGYDWVVDLDLEKFFDRVNHDKLMSLVKGRVADRRVLYLSGRYLKAGALTGDGFEATGEGTPQGAAVAPVSKPPAGRPRAGQRVLASVTRFLARRLKLTVNAVKSAVDRPWRRTFLGFTFTRRRPHRSQVSKKALKALKKEIRQRTCRTRGFHSSVSCRI